jgi:hypothetical protein
MYWQIKAWCRDCGWWPPIRGERHSPATLRRNHVTQCDMTVLSNVCGWSTCRSCGGPSTTRRTRGRLDGSGGSP